MNRVAKFIFSFVIFIAVCYVGLRWFIHSEVEKGLQAAVAESPGMSLSYSDLSVDLANPSVILEDVVATLGQGQHFTASLMRISSFDQAHPVPHHMTLEAWGLVCETTPRNMGDLAYPLSSLGIESITADCALDYVYNPDTDTLEVKRLDILAKDLADAKLTGTIDKLDLDDFRLGQFIGLRISKADLTLVNRSLVNTIIESTAQGLGISDADAKERVSAELDSMARYAGKQGNMIAEDALRGIRRFMVDPGTVTLSANPGEPVPLIYFFMGRDMYDNMRLINLEVKTDSSDKI